MPRISSRRTTPRPSRNITATEILQRYRAMQSTQVQRPVTISTWDSMFPSSNIMTITSGTTTVPTETPATPPPLVEPEPVVLPPPSEPPRKTLADLLPLDPRGYMVRSNKIHNRVFKYQGEWVFGQCCDYNYRGDYESLQLVPLLRYHDYAYRKGSTVVPVKKSFSEFFVDEFDFTSHKTGMLQKTPTSVTYVTAPNLNTPGEDDVWTGAVGLSYGSLRFTVTQHTTDETMQDLVNMLEGSYPSLESTWNKISPTLVEDHMSLALSTNFAVSRDTLSVVTLKYRDQQIGEVVLPGSIHQIKLYPAYKHLKRQIKSELGLDLEVFAVN